MTFLSTRKIGQPIQPICQQCLVLSSYALRNHCRNEISCIFLQSPHQIEIRRHSQMLKIFFLVFHDSRNITGKAAVKASKQCWHLVNTRLECKMRYGTPCIGEFQGFFDFSRFNKMLSNRPILLWASFFLRRTQQLDKIFQNWSIAIVVNGKRFIKKNFLPNFWSLFRQPELYFWPTFRNDTGSDYLKGGIWIIFASHLEGGAALKLP